jgi:hypothetical protein
MRPVSRDVLSEREQLLLPVEVDSQAIRHAANALSNATKGEPLRA